MTVRQHPISAVGAARIISRILREDGFQRASGRNEGYFVHRVGYSVHVGYHDHARNQIRAWNQIALMRETLFELGYVSSHPREIYIECREA